MRILAIETSCDETAAAVVENGVKLLSNIVASSEELHQKTGGIVPEVAAREQVRSMIPVISESLITNIDAIAVTTGPGLIGSLLIGVETAKALAFAWNKPLIAVNHLIGHIYGNFVDTDLASKDIFPAVVLVASGGHSDLILLKNHGDMVWLGGTLDDAAGEAFDKAARLLGLGYPGGPAISKAASTIEPFNHPTIKLPRPLLNDSTFDFSFSGLKTALYNTVKQSPTLTSDQTTGLAHEFQEAVTDCLVTKTIKAATEFKAKSIMLAGGVAANKRLREKLGNSAGIIPVFCPAIKFCTDNAAMIGSAAFFNQNFVNWENLEPDSSLSLQQFP